MSTTISPVESRLASLESSLGLTSIASPGGSNAAVSSPVINSRIDRILSDMNSKVKERQTAAASGSSSAGRSSASTGNLDQDFGEIDRLMVELDAGSVMSHQGTAGLSSGAAAAQQPLTAPLLYRRQEVLASAEALAVGMERLGEVRNLLAATSVSTGGGSTGVRGAAASTGSKASALAKKTASSQNSSQSATEDQASTDRFANAPLLTSERYEYATDAEARRRLHDVYIQVADINARAVDVATRVDNLVSQYHRVMIIMSEKCVLADEELSALEKKKQL